MGLYDALGVRPTHLDLQDGGVPFGSLGLRTLVTHNGGALSPANNQLRLAEEQRLREEAAYFSSVSFT